MPSDAARPPVPPGPDVDPSLRRTYTLVIVVEVIVVASLYWLGRHFS